jgi:hypothetical protein
MKIIFLDFDGVINNTETFVKRENLAALRTGRMPREQWLEQSLETNLVNRVEKIAKATKARVVVSSAWRIGETVDSLKDILSLKNGHILRLV